MNSKNEFKALVDYLSIIPGIVAPIETGILEEDNWWVKFSIDIENDLAWNVVQELGHVLNYVSISERLPTVFMPISPPPYMNGGPKDFLSWVIESNDSNFKPDTCMKWLEERLPNPVNDLPQWQMDE